LQVEVEAEEGEEVQEDEDWEERLSVYAQSVVKKHLIQEVFLVHKQSVQNAKPQ
jgi:hypothetical protein